MTHVAPSSNLSFSNETCYHSRDTKFSTLVTRTTKEFMKTTITSTRT